MTCPHGLGPGCSECEVEGSPPPTEAEIQTLARRLARVIDTNVRVCEYAIRRMLTRGLIEIVEVPNAE